MTAVLTTERRPLSDGGRGGRGGLCVEPVPRTREESNPERVGRDPSDARAGGRLTLEQRLDSVWEGLHAGGAADCPVCHERLGLGRAGGAAIACGGCGSTLC